MGGGVSKAAVYEEEENFKEEQELVEKTPEERKAELISLVEDLSRDPEEKEDEESFYCAISHGLMVDPVYAVTKETKLQLYDRPQIEQWWPVHPNDPISRSPITELIEATELKNKILTYRTSTIDKCLDAAEDLIAWDEPDVALKALERANHLMTMWLDRGVAVEGEDARRDLLHENYSALIELNFAKFKELLVSDMQGAVKFYEDARKSAINWQAGNFVQDFAKQARVAYAHCQEKFDEAIKESAAMLLQGEVPNPYSLMNFDKLTQDWASHGPIIDETKDERMGKITGLCEKIIDFELRDFEQLLNVNQDFSAALELCETVKKISKEWGVQDFDYKFMSQMAQINACYKERFFEKAAEFELLLDRGKIQEAAILAEVIQQEAMRVGNNRSDDIYSRCRNKIDQYLQEIDQATYGRDLATGLELLNRVKDITEEFKGPFFTRRYDFAPGVQNREKNLKAFEDPKKMIFEAIGSGDLALLKLCLAIASEMANVAPRDESNPYWQKDQRPFGGSSGSYLMYEDIADNNTPLHCAAKRNQKEMCELLIGCGASLKVQNDNGKTPQTLAAYHGHKTLFKRIAESDVESPKQAVETLRKRISVEPIREDEVTLTMTPRSMLQLTEVGRQEGLDR